MNQKQFAPRPGKTRMVGEQFRNPKSRYGIEEVGKNTPTN
jgi:hypothetical protein